MREFIQGFCKGAKETPVAYFAPAIAVWQLLLETTESLLEKAPAVQKERVYG